MRSAHRRKNRLKIRSDDLEDREYSIFGYFATEGNFEILFKNLYDNNFYDDDGEIPVVEVTIWYPRGGYREGYGFMTTLEECVSFFDALKAQFTNLTQQSL